MKTTATLVPPAQPALKRGVLARLRRVWTELDEPTAEEAQRRILSKPGFFASLSPEALEYLRNYDGPENLGPPDGPRRSDLDPR